MDIGSYLGIFSALLAGEYVIQPQDVFGVIFSNNLPEQYVRFDSGNPHLNAKPENPIIFIAHGWMENRDVTWYKELTEAFLKQNQNNIVVQVDWSKGSRLPRPSAVKNNKPVGEIIGKFISQLIKTNHLSLSQFHLVGFSMGGQVSGFAGKKIKALTGHKVGRITALDPSGRSYNEKPEEDRLNPQDAEVVAVIHTDAVQIGFKHPCGTVDLYANGIVFPQPGCPDKLDLIELVYCSHFRAHRYFIEAVLKGSFIGTKCDSYEKYREGFCSGNEKLNFAGNISAHQNGVYYLTTNSESPFLK